MISSFYAVVLRVIPRTTLTITLTGRRFAAALRMIPMTTQLVQRCTVVISRCYTVVLRVIPRINLTIFCVPAVDQ